MIAGRRVESRPKPQAQANKKARICSPALEISSQRLAGKRRRAARPAQMHPPQLADKAHDWPHCTRQSRKCLFARVNTDKRQLSPVWRRLDPQESQQWPCACACPSTRATPSPQSPQQSAQAAAVVAAYRQRIEGNSPCLGHIQYLASATTCRTIYLPSLLARQKLPLAHVNARVRRACVRALNREP